MQEVGKLLANVESTRAELAPRQKFAFRSKRKARERQTQTVSSPAITATRENSEIGEIRMVKSCTVAVLLTYFSRAGALLPTPIETSSRFHFSVFIFGVQFPIFHVQFLYFSLKLYISIRRGTRWKLAAAGRGRRSCRSCLFRTSYTHRNTSPCWYPLSRKCLYGLSCTTSLHASFACLVAAAAHQHAIYTLTHTLTPTLFASGGVHGVITQKKHLFYILYIILERMGRNRA